MRERNGRSWRQWRDKKAGKQNRNGRMKREAKLIKAFGHSQHLAHESFTPHTLDELYIVVDANFCPFSFLCANDERRRLIALEPARKKKCRRHMGEGTGRMPEH